MKAKIKFSKKIKLLTPEEVRQMIREVKEDLKEIDERRKVDYSKLNTVITI